MEDKINETNERNRMLEADQECRELNDLWAARRRYRANPELPKLPVQPTPTQQDTTQRMKVKIRLPIMPKAGDIKQALQGGRIKILWSQAQEDKLFAERKAREAEDARVRELNRLQSVLDSCLPTNRKFGNFAQLISETRPSEMLKASKDRLQRTLTQLDMTKTKRQPYHTTVMQLQDNVKCFETPLEAQQDLLRQKHQAMQEKLSQGPILKTMINQMKTFR